MQVSACMYVHVYMRYAYGRYVLFGGMYFAHIQTIKKVTFTYYKTIYLLDNT